MVRGHEGVLSWHAGDGESDGWRPDLIVGYMGKRSNAADALLRLGRQCMHKRGKKVLQAAQLGMRMPGVYAGLKAQRGYAPDQTIFNTVSQEGDACKVTEGQPEGERLFENLREGDGLSVGWGAPGNSVLKGRREGKEGPSGAIAMPRGVEVHKFPLLRKTSQGLSMPTK